MAHWSRQRAEMIRAQREKDRLAEASRERQLEMARREEALARDITETSTEVRSIFSKIGRVIGGQTFADIIDRHPPEGPAWDG